MKDLHDLARTAAALPDALQDAQIRGVKKAALLTTRNIRDQVKSATGGDMRMSGVGKRGAKIGARYDVKGKVNPTARIKATGKAFPLLDRDTDAHDIPKVRGRRSRKKRKVLLLPDGNFRSTVHHPGTRGKHMWEKGLTKSRPLTQRVFKEEIHNAVVKAVRG